ncbi:hypothetical protein NLM31_12745 [Bradyrhizobium sp. CCGUVB4N]|uniref:DUF7665 family protein n=1 Tax=Bradyrhizobium sp. CCGUVB4N TaxID=2949631 RepID=UPI0020B1FACE|nr:hypothetical protein [Bradyrhizobium sp. CCGUVB4N]MCP3381208.1 hypothetical protein [Bradyrhizobium sp. CCGUVB4N]
MLPPDQRLFESHLLLPEYRDGLAKELWGHVVGDDLPPGTAWPNVVFWMAAARREGAPDHYHVALNLSGYSTQPPTGPLWDPATKQTLAFSKWPKGKPGSRFAIVFRTDGFSFAGKALYHPYDRSPLSDHPEWKSEPLRPVWTSSHTIIDYLEEFQSLLTSEDYLGI